jgi:small conductance mechanosensitive channel
VGFTSKDTRSWIFRIPKYLQNFLAGIILLLQEPFRLGDLISVTGIEGNVSDIQSRATIVITKRRRKVIIPNAAIFTNPVAVAHHDLGTPLKVRQERGPQRSADHAKDLHARRQ